VGVTTNEAESAGRRDRSGTGDFELRARCVELSSTSGIDGVISVSLVKGDDLGSQKVVSSS